MASVPANSVLAQQLWAARVTLFAENMCLAPRLYGKGEDSAVVVEDRQEVGDSGDGRGSKVTFRYGDRFRGQSLQPKPLGATGFGQETGQRPVYEQDMNMQAQELSSCFTENLVAGQTYTNVPLEKKELHNCGAEAAELICRSDYYHLAGLTAYNSSGTLWGVSPNGNDVTELDELHQFWTGSQSSDSGVAGTTSAILTVEYVETVITALQNRASGVLSPLVPAKTPWGSWFIAICDSEGMEQLTRHSTTNRVMSLTLAEIQGGNAPDKVASFMQANSGFQGTRRVLYLVDDYTPFGQSGSTPGATTAGTQIGHVRRMMILGQQAAHKKWGRGFDADSAHIKCSYHSEYERTGWKFFTHCGMVASIAGPAGNLQRFGSATLSYYVTAATPSV